MGFCFDKKIKTVLNKNKREKKRKPYLKPNLNTNYLTQTGAAQPS
jgi:hypothetical protein